MASSSSVQTLPGCNKYLDVRCFLPNKRKKSNLYAYTKVIGKESSDQLGKFILQEQAYIIL